MSLAMPCRILTCSSLNFAVRFAGSSVARPTDMARASPENRVMDSVLVETAKSSSFGFAASAAARAAAAAAIAWSSAASLPFAKTGDFPLPFNSLIGLGGSPVGLTVK